MNDDHPHAAVAASAASPGRPIGDLAEERGLEPWQLAAVLARRDLFARPDQSLEDALRTPITAHTLVSPEVFAAAVKEALHGRV